MSNRKYIEENVIYVINNLANSEVHRYKGTWQKYTKKT